MIEKHRVHRFAHLLVAAERERQVRHPARHVHVRQVLPDPARSFDESHAVAVVLLHPGRDCEDVGIEDDVLRREADTVHQDVVGARADRTLALERIRLALFVERHDDDRGTVPAHDLGMFKKCRLALLERDRVHHRLALDTFQPGLDHREFRAVDHHRHARDVGLGRDQVEEGNHGLFGIEQALVHVDVDDLRAVLDLVARDRERGGVVAGGDKFPELRRTGDIGALADIDEWDFGREREGFEAGETKQRRHFGDLARRLAGDRLGNRRDMLRRGAAAAADHIDEARVGEFRQQRCHVFGRLVVAAELVRQPGVRIGADQRVGDAPDLGDMRAHLFGAERTVEPNRKRRGVADRIPERRRRLP